MSPLTRKLGRTVNVAGLIAPGEAEVMEIIWDRGGCLVSEITEILNARRSEPLQHNTVLTLCTRLCHRGLLHPERVGRAYRYDSITSRANFVKEQAMKALEVLLDRFGDAALATFIDQVSSDPEQLSALRGLLMGAECTG